MKCAETLKDTISPYLLQRFKIDVAADLPKKSEQVLFCKLTKLQREAYEIF
jgi:DNA excision repair protein ERCC-6